MPIDSTILRPVGIPDSTPQENALDDRIVWVVISKLDAHWRRSEGEGDVYLKRGQGRPGTYEYLHEATSKGVVLRMPHIGFWWDGSKRISFTDGRHRFSWVRDHSGHAMPVTFHKSDAPLARKMFGSRSRTCRVSVYD